jgi:hypothetical protein
MSNATNTLEAMIGDALFLGVPMPTVTQWTVCLYSTAPDEAGVGGVELNGGGYVPVQLNPAGGRWTKDPAQNANGETVYRNGQAVLFAAATAQWPTVNHFGLKDQSGQLLIVGALAAPRTIASGQSALFMIGELQIPIG